MSDCCPTSCRTANHESRTTNHGIIACPVVILCGGLGLRLRAAIQDKPKCLAPIAGQPFLEWLLGSLQRQGCVKVVLCLGYGSDQVVEFLERREVEGKRQETRDERRAMLDSEFRITDSGLVRQMETRYVIERQPLGTGGALRNAAPLIYEDHFLAMNGDTIFDLDLEELLRAHTHRNALATIALRRNPAETARYGGVTIDAEGRIVRFAEKSVDENAFVRPPHLRLGGPPSPSGGRGTGMIGREAGATFINGGVYAFAKEIFNRIPGPPASVSLEKDVFPAIVGRHFYGFPCDGYFLDIGIPEDYQKAQTELPKRLMLW